MRTFLNQRRWSLALCLVTGWCLFWAANGLAQSDTIRVTLETSKGNITLSLYETKAPITVANFLRYVDEGFYNGTIFHRVIAGFMIQGGGMDTLMAFKPTYEPIKNESDNGILNTKYTIAMARTAVPDSATSQFFINVADNSWLNPTATTAGYTVFGQVIAGKDVVDAIAAVPTAALGGHENVPVTAVVINKASRSTVVDNDDDDSSSCFITTAINPKR